MGIRLSAVLKGHDDNQKLSAIGDNTDVIQKFLQHLSVLTEQNLAFL